MNVALQIIFWANVGFIAYVYFGYPMVLWLLSRLKGERLAPLREDFEPTVSLIIAAYNEEQVIGQTLENCLTLDYPQDKLEIIVVSDGSTDRTTDIVSQYRFQGLRLVNLPQNVGKASAQNEAVKQAIADILLFSDAEAFLRPDAIRKLIRCFQDDRIGCAVGRVVYLNEKETNISEGEGFYWRYELFLRQNESRLGNLAMGSGSILAVRRKLFKPLDPSVSEDFVLPMHAVIQGYKVVYEPNAEAKLRLFQVSPESMFKTKVRTIMLDTRSMFLCRAILNPLRYPLYAWGLISHKLLRWLVPYFLIFLFAVNLFLLGKLFYNLILGVQIILYVLAMVGYLWQKTEKPPQVLGILFSFCLVNAAALIGVANFAMGKKSGSWKPVR